MADGYDKANWTVGLQPSSHEGSLWQYSGVFDGLLIMLRTGTKSAATSNSASSGMRTSAISTIEKAVTNARRIWGSKTQVARRTGGTVQRAVRRSVSGGGSVRHPNNSPGLRQRHLCVGVG